MLQRTAAYMKQQQINLNGEKVIIGLSGGMDSVCLFHILKDLGVSLEAVHVNHQIRGEEAKRDEQFVKNLCARYNIPFHGYRYDVPKISRENHLSEEEAGRMVRKEAFARVMKEQGAGYVALAHHGNDRAETFLFHLGRGTGVKGLGSMKPVQGTIIRPLLWAERKEIEQYVQEKGYEFVEDATNSQTEYTRNKIRHEIIPALEEINPRCIPHICGAAEKLSAVSAYIDREAEKLCRLSAVMYGQEVQILKLAFEQGDEVLRIPVLQKCVEYLSGSLVNITEEHLEKLGVTGNMISRVRVGFDGLRILRDHPGHKFPQGDKEGSGAAAFAQLDFLHHERSVVDEILQISCQRIDRKPKKSRWPWPPPGYRRCCSSKSGSLH